MTTAQYQNQEIGIDSVLTTRLQTLFSFHWFYICVRVCVCVRAWFYTMLGIDLCDPTALRMQTVPMPEELSVSTYDLVQELVHAVLEAFCKLEMRRASGVIQSESYSPRTRSAEV